jgi:hypothetical protein
MTDWNIQTRAHACQQCGRAFTDREPYHTVLTENQASYVRRDVCAACWLRERDETGAGAPHYISHWQGVYELPPPPSELIRKETAETLLRKLVELGEPRYLAPVFILAVMLERKRLLKVKDQIHREGRKTLIYERHKSGEVLTVTDPELGIDQLEQVQRDVSRLLEHGLTEPVTAPLPEGEAPDPASATEAATKTDQRNSD